MFQPSVEFRERFMVTSLCLIIIVIIFYKKRVLRKGSTTRQLFLYSPLFVVRNSLSIQSLSFRGEILTVFCVKIALSIDSGHIVHRGRHGGFYPVSTVAALKRHASPSADADYSLFYQGSHIILNRKKIYCGLKVPLRIDVRRSDIAGKPPLSPVKRWIKCDRQKALFGHCLGIKP